MKDLGETNIYLVRHAHSRYTPEELTRPLSERGMKDAERITELLANEGITQVISSPYQRAIETVQGTAALMGLGITLDDGLRERKLAGSSVENFDEAVLKVWEDFNFSFPGGESGYCAQARGVQSLKEILQKYNSENIAVGTHGNIMVLIMNYFDKKYNYDFWISLSMPDIYKLSFKNDELFMVTHLI